MEQGSFFDEVIRPVINFAVYFLFFAFIWFSLSEGFDKKEVLKDLCIKDKIVKACEAL